MSKDSFKKAMELGSAWLDYSLRHCALVIEEMKSLSPRKKLKAQAKFANELGFIMKRDIDPRFHKHVTKILKKRDKEIKELAFHIMFDLLRKTDPTPKEIQKSGFDPRQSHRIRYECYPELFFTTKIKRIGKKKVDKRKQPYKAVFSHEYEPPRNQKTIDAIKLMVIQEHFTSKYQQEFLDQMKVHAYLRYVDPNEIKGLVVFSEYLKSLNKKIGDPKGEMKWLSSQIKNRDKVVQLLHHLITTAVAMRWFRNRTLEKQEELLRHTYKLSYNKEDAHQTVYWYNKWLDDTNAVYDHVHLGASGYRGIGKPKSAIYLYQECLAQLILEKDVQALCHSNTAQCYRDLKKPRIMLIELIKTLSLFEELDRPWDIGITKAFLADSYYLLNRKEDAEKAIEDSINILSDASIEPERRTEGFLEVADMGLRIEDNALEKRAVELAIESSSELMDPYCFQYFNQRLTDLTMGKNTATAEKEPGKLQHPKSLTMQNPFPSLFYANFPGS